MAVPSAWLFDWLDRDTGETSSLAPEQFYHHDLLWLWSGGVRREGVRGEGGSEERKDGNADMR